MTLPDRAESARGAAAGAAPRLPQAGVKAPAVFANAAAGSAAAEPSDAIEATLQQALARGGVRICCAPSVSLQAPSRSSRRRRLWDLQAHTHCPVIGVCLPLDAARRLAGQALGGEVLAGDYELHCGLVSECKRRSRVAERVNKALDQRHAGALRAAAACKTPAELGDWWRAQAPGDGLAGALWAVITHPDCDHRLEQQVLGEVHMRQHQIGHEQRAEWGRLQALQRDNAALQTEVKALRARVAQQAGALSAQREQAQSQAMRLRGDLLARETRIAQLEQEAATLHAAAPDLPARRVLAEQLQHVRERALMLQRALDRAEATAERARAEPVVDAGLQAQAAPAQPPGDVAAVNAAGAVPDLRACSVLCVGGRAAAVPTYRALLEGLGARFQHHDGGHEHGPQRLQASLAAADLVICQAGCISHDAYWRVKDHCKRTGKRCVFVESPGTGALERALKSALAQGARTGRDAVPDSGVAATQRP
jgi:hypothetical protein